MAVSVTNRRPALLALAASFLLTLLIIVGSRSLEHYDAALFGYTIASVVAFGAIVFRYAIWLQRPATRVYWRRGWNLYLQREKFLQNTASAAKTVGNTAFKPAGTRDTICSAMNWHGLRWTSGLKKSGSSYSPFRFRSVRCWSECRRKCGPAFTKKRMPRSEITSTEKKLRSGPRWCWLRGRSESEQEV